MNLKPHPSLQAQAKKILLEGLESDQWQWDFTSGLIQNDKKIKASILAKESGVICIEPVLFALQQYAHENQINWNFDLKFKDGDFVQKGSTLVQIQGDHFAVLGFERWILNLSSYLSGISTKTNKLQKILNDSNLKSKPKILSTRKTLPFYRDLSLYAVICGGGALHRLNLGAGILIKENHIRTFGSISNAILHALNSSPHLLSIEVEVTCSDEVQEAIQNKNVKAVLLDNMSPQEVQKQVEWIHKNRPEILIEVSGGIHLDNISQYCIEGVNFISVGGLTHSVQSMDLSLIVDLE